MKKASRLLILLLVLSALLIGCGDSGNGKTTDTAGSTHDPIDYDGGDRPTSIYFKTFDDVLSFMNDPGEVGYHHNYVIEHSKSIGYTYSVESSNQEFSCVGITPYTTRSADGGIIFDTHIQGKDYVYTYKVRVLIKDTTVEYSGDIVEYSLKRFFGYFSDYSKIREEYIYRTFTAQNGLGDFCVEYEFEGEYSAYAEIDSNYYISVKILLPDRLPPDVVDCDAYLYDHETHMDALEEFVNSLTLTKVQI